MTNQPSSEQINATIERVRALLQKGEFQQAWTACKEILNFDPENKEAKTVLDEIERSGKLMAVGEQKEIDSRAINCPKCNASLRITQKDAETAACASCGAVLDLESDELKILANLNPKKYSPRSFVKLGMIGKFDGKKYQVIGRTCYSATIREWDSEDNQYCTGPWSFDEWVLAGENKEYVYLYEDEQCYALSRPFTPTAPRIPEPNETHFSLLNNISPQRITEFTTAHLQYFEGEFTWLPRLGELIKGVEYKYALRSHSVEWRVGEDGTTVKEVEFFESEPISRLDLAIAFDAEQIIAEERTKIAEEKEYKKWAVAFYVGAGLCFLLLLGSCLSSGKNVVTYTLAPYEATEQGVVKGPFELKKTGTVHKISLSTTIPDNSSAWGGIELLDESQSAISVMEGDFWRESGRDSEGAWSESSVNSEYYFRLDKAGKYFIRMFVEGARPGSGAMRVSISEDIMLSRYYLVGLLFCLGFGCAVQRYKSLNPWYAVIGLFALGFFIISKMDTD